MNIDTIKRATRALLLAGGLMLAALGGAPAFACPEGGGTCQAASSGPASQPLGAALNVGAGNPINVMSGNKYQRDDDMPALPGVLGLEIVRHYNSIHSGTGDAPGMMGRGWKLSYETELLVGAGGMQLRQADGSVTNFSRDPLRPEVAVAGNPAWGVIHVRRRHGAEEYLWRWTEGRELLFDQRGKLVQIKAATGEILSLLYDAAGLLVKVTDPQGRSLRLVYRDRKAAARGDLFRGVQGIDSPVGRFNYEYGSSLPRGAVIDPRYLLTSLVKVRHPDDAVVRDYHYEDGLHPTLLTGISVGGARFATFAYNAAGKGVLSSHAGGAGKVTLDFQRPGLTVVSNSLGQKTSYRYALQDDDYRLLEVRGAGCAACGPVNRSYAYNRSGQLTETTALDAQGAPLQTARTELDALGRPLRISRQSYAAGTAPAARTVVRYEYASAQSTQATLIARPSVVDGKEMQTRVVYNAYGQPLSSTESGWTPAVENMPGQAIERTTRYRYRVVNGRSLLMEIDGPLANGKAGLPADSDITRFDYDATGSYLIRTVAPGNIVTEVRQRDAALRPLLVVSSDGVRLTSVEEQLASDGQVVRRAEASWLLDAKGRPDAATKVVNTLRYQYDDHARLASTQAAGQRMTAYRYDAAGNLTQVTAGDQSKIIRDYDSEGALTAESRYGPWGGAGVRQSYADAGGAATLDEQAGRIVQQWPDAQQPLTASYQLGRADTAATGQVETATRPDGSTVRRWIDDFGRMVATRSPEHGLQVAGYDAADALVTLRDARGVLITIARDVQGRMREVRYHDADGTLAQRRELRYEGVALKQETRFEQGRADSRITWLLDAWGQVSGKQLTIYRDDGGVAADFTVANESQPAQQTMRQSLPSGAAITYRYDTEGRVVGIELDGQPLLSDVRYAQTMTGLRPVSFNYGNGLRSASEYDQQGQLVRHINGPDSVTMVHDADGRNIVMERTAAPVVAGNGAAGRWSWLGALIGQANAAPAALPANGAARRLAYDTHGRLTTESRGNLEVLNARYDRLGNRLGEAPTVVDADGNVLAHGRFKLTYAASGELVRVTGADNAQIATYRYDAQGRRIAKHTKDENRYFVYHDGQLLAEADGAGRVVAEYIYLGRRPVARLRYAEDGGRSWLPGSRAAPVVEYLHTDQRDAVDAVSADDGKVIWRGELDAFGALRTETGDRTGMPLRLAGQYADPETGLHYNVHRYYDPAAGRYLQADPIGIAAGFNMYAYAGDDPMHKTDPLGLDTDDGYTPGTAPWLFGIFVHNAFTEQIRPRANGWGANDGRSGTWTALRPDAYQVKPTTPTLGSVWELKPASWATGPNYGKGVTQVASYIAGADPKKGICWSAGSSSALVETLKPNQVIMGGDVYEVTYHADPNDASGLLFYSREKLQKKEAPQTIPVPVLSKKEDEDLKSQMQAVKTQAATEGLSTLQVIGIVVVIAVVIAALLYFFPWLVSSILAALGNALRLAAMRQVSFMSALAAIFGLNLATLPAEAQAKGEQKEKGLLDGTIGWFKSWF
jgi:RHS repeat-associated protein